MPIHFLALKYINRKSTSIKSAKTIPPIISKKVKGKLKNQLMKIEESIPTPISRNIFVPYLHNIAAPYAPALLCKRAHITLIGLPAQVGRRFSIFSKNFFLSMTPPPSTTTPGLYFLIIGDNFIPRKLTSPAYPRSNCYSQHPVRHSVSDSFGF